MNNSTYQESWGVYHWFPNGNMDHLIKPEHLSVATSLLPHGKVLHCVAQNSLYITLKYGNVFLDVKPDLYKKVTPLKFDVGECVLVPRKDYSKFYIQNILWHYDLEKAMYYLRSDTKKISRRYTEDELESCPPIEGTGQD